MLWLAIAVWFYPLIVFAMFLYDLDRWRNGDWQEEEELDGC